MLLTSTAEPAGPSGASKVDSTRQNRGRLSDHCRRQRQLLFPAEGARSIRTAAARADAAARGIECQR